MHGDKADRAFQVEASAFLPPLQSDEPSGAKGEGMTHTFCPWQGSLLTWTRVMVLEGKGLGGAHGMREGAVLEFALG